MAISGALNPLLKRIETTAKIIAVLKPWMKINWKHANIAVIVDSMNANHINWVFTVIKLTFAPLIHCSSPRNTPNGVKKKKLLTAIITPHQLLKNLRLFQ